MSTWIIEPHDPTIFRDGRPFGPTPGARARSLSFPFPSTTAGGVRGLVGLNDDGMFTLDRDDAPVLKTLAVRGPLLVRLAQDGHAIDAWFVPAPADALIMKGKDSDNAFTVQQLVPLQPLMGAQSDLSSSSHHRERPQGAANLLFVGQRKTSSRQEEGKAASNAPAFWNWERYMEWLERPDTLEQRELADHEIGIGRLPQELRVHVGMDSEKHMSHYGALFDTSGLEFTVAGKQAQRLSDARRLALVVEIDGDREQQIAQEKALTGARERLGSFGGERRIVSWRKSSSNLPSCPSGLSQKICEDRACRLILLTPAYFEHYYYPQWLLGRRAGIEIAPTLEAIAIQRPQVVSGWDMVKHRPRKTKRLAPAGTVLYLKLEGNEQQIRAWIDRTWLQCVSDDDNDKEENPDPEQFRLDGFGLAALGTWSGKPAPMKES